MTAQEIQSLFRYEAGYLYWIQPPKRHPKLLGRIAGCLNRAGYRVIASRTRRDYAHRLIWIMHNGPIPEGLEVDHINRVKHDNRLENLRLVTQGDNGQNREAKRIYRHRNRWIFMRMINGQKTWKSFRTEAEAIDFSRQL